MLDAENDHLTAVLAGQPSHGDVVLQEDGSFVYTPETDFSGIVTFHYRAHDSQAQSNVAIVTLDVMPEPNQAPTAAGDAYTTTINVILTVPAPGVLGNDNDGDGDILTAVLVSGPIHGQLSLGMDGSFTYAPDTDFSGQDNFTYQAFDGLDYSDPAMVIITVEPGPPAKEFLVYLPVILQP